MPRRILLGLLASAVSLTVTLLVLEIGLRVFGIGSDSLAQPHPWTGWVLIPNRRADIESEDTRAGRRMRVATNSLGLRDVDRAVAKPPGVYRVLVLGDSFVEGVQVPLDSTLTRRLERALDGRGGLRVEVWNCGVDGYTTSQELLYLEHVGARFDPDLVVLCFLSGNDVADQVPDFATSLRNRPFFRMRESELVLDRSFFKPDAPIVGWLRNHSRLFSWASTKRQVILMRLRGAASPGPDATGIPPALQIYAERPDSMWAVAWRITERLIVAVRDEAGRQGADFLLVSISNGVQEHPEARARWPEWAQVKDSSGISLDQPERRLGRVAEANAIDYLPLLPGFRAELAAAQQTLHIDWTGHWNSAGHAHAARLVSEKIAARIEHGGSAASTNQP